MPSSRKVESAGIPAPLLTSCVTSLSLDFLISRRNKTGLDISEDQLK